jgi:5-methylcytosine-specific restriction endonuclease McrA
MKVCHVCRKDSGGKYHCNDCGEKHNERTKLARRERKKNGYCTDCGQERDTNWVRCSKCQKKETNKVKKRNQQRKEEGKCNIFNCENKKLDNSRFCDAHRIERLEYAQKRDIELIKKGLCTGCASEKYMEHYKDKVDIRTKWCQTCYLKMLSARHFGVVSQWENLFEILKQQNFICPYTGDKLILGINDSVDHIFPRSLYPEKTKDINNMRWVTRTINNMKYDLLDNDFCAEISKIIRHLGADPKIETSPQI